MIYIFALVILFLDQGSQGQGSHKQMIVRNHGKKPCNLQGL